MKHFISVIITTYNWPGALRQVLLSLKNQSVQNFEVIVADDGSDEKTANLIGELALNLPFNIRHVWQEDKGFRAAKIRNKAVAHAQGEYLIFIDGDCVLPKNFISRHYTLAENDWFISGNRILLSEKLTAEILHNQWQIFHWDLFQWWNAWRKSECNRFFPLLSFPDIFFRKMKKNRWQGVKTCNLSLWRRDFISVNGFDEDFTGWGYEDSDLIIRLLKKGVRRKDGRFAVPVFHLWHLEQDRSNAQQNFEKLKHSQLASEKTVRGIDQYLNEAVNQ